MASWRRVGTYTSATGTSARTQIFPEAAAQSFKAGDFVNLSSGKVQLAVAASGTYASADLNNANILGMVTHDATGVTDSDVTVVLASDDTLFCLPVLHNTPASAVTAITQVGTVYDIAHYTLGGVTAWGVTLDDTADPCVEVVDIIDPVGEQYGLVLVKVLAAARDLE